MKELELVSPLLGKRLPELAELGTWFDEEGRRVLEGAARLAAWRCSLESMLNGAPEIRAISSRNTASKSVTRTDLLRAILALQPDALGVSSLRDFSLADAPARWAQAIAKAPPEPLPTSVETSVARAWVLEHARDPATQIGLRAILGAIGFEGAMALSAFDTQYVEGLITLQESACRILDARADTSACAPVFPIYLDRNRCLAQVDAALTAGPGVVVVAERAGFGRHALLEAWIQRLVYERIPETLAPLEGGRMLSALDVRRLNQDFFDSSSDAILFGLSRGKRGAYLDLRQAVGFRPGWVDDLAVVAEDARSPDYKVIVTITKDRERQLEDAHPFYKGLPKVEVIPPRDDDLLPLWWCQLPMVERRVGITANLPVLIEAFARSTDEQRAQPSWWTVAQALERLRIDEGLDLRLAPRAPPGVRWRRALRSVRAGSKVVASDQAFLGRFVGARERLLDLAMAGDNMGNCATT